MLLIVIVALYMVTGFLDAVGITSISNMFLLPFWFLLLSLFTWLGVRFTGQVPEVGAIIDEGAQMMADNASPFAFVSF